MKRVAALLLALVMILALTACGSKTDAPAPEESTSPETAPPEETSVAPITIKFAHNKSEDSYTHNAALLFKEKAAELSGGAIVIEVYSNSQLGDETEVRDGLVMGTVDMGSVATGNMASIAHEFTMFDVPYLITTDEQVDKILLDPESPVRQRLDEGAYNGGIKVLSWADAGFRCFANNVRPLETPADLDGVKMRTPAWPMLMAVVEHFNGVPTSMAFSEVYLALSQGVIDGFEQPLWGIVQERMYEVCKYVSVNNHLANDDLYCMSAALWNKLDEQQQAILIEAAQAATDWQTEELRKDTAGFIDLLESEGVEVTRELDYDLWSSETAFVLDEYADDIDMETVELVKGMK